MTVCCCQLTALQRANVAKASLIFGRFQLRSYYHTTGVATASSFPLATMLFFSSHGLLLPFELSNDPPGLRPVVPCRPISGLHLEFPVSLRCVSLHKQIRCGNLVTLTFPIRAGYPTARTFTRFIKDSFTGFRFRFPTVKIFSVSPNNLTFMLLACNPRKGGRLLPCIESVRGVTPWRSS